MNKRFIIGGAVVGILALGALFYAIGSSDLPEDSSSESVSVTESSAVFSQSETESTSAERETSALTTTATPETTTVTTQVTETTSVTSAEASAITTAPPKTTTAPKTTTTAPKTTAAVTVTTVPDATTAAETTTPAATTIQTTTDASAAAYVDEVIRLVNLIRVENGLGELSAPVALSDAAAKRALEISQTFSHTRPDGTRCFGVLGEYGIGYRTCGENIAGGYRDPKSVVDGWMNSEGHKRNILTPEFTSIGVGYDPQSNSWVQLFVG